MRRSFQWKVKQLLHKGPTQDEKNAKLLNLFFSGAVKNLKIAEFSDTNPLTERLSDPTLKAIQQ